MTQVKYGLVGCGHNAGKHAEAVPHADLVSICDINPLAMQNLCAAKNLGDVQMFTDYGAFLKSGIEAVIINTPDNYHIPNALEAMEAGLHMLVEKPLITTMDDFQTLRGLVDQAGQRRLIFMTCHPKRFDPPWVWLKHELPKHQATLGRIVSVNFDYSYFDAGPTGQRRFAGSFLVHHVSHEYDLLNFLFGYSKSKSRVLAESCDDYEVVGKRELNSVTFHLRGMLSLRRQMQVETMIVRYERGTVTLRICGSKAMCIIHDHEKNPGENMVDIPAPDKDWDLRMRRVTENFINSIRGTEVPYLTSVDMQLSAQIGPFLSMNADAASIV